MRPGPTSSLVRPGVTSLTGTKAIYAVATVAEPEMAPPLAAALAGAGIEALEITMRTPKALEALAAAAARDVMVVGAGTVVDAAAASAAVAAGASFLVSPGYDRGLADHCRNIGVPLLPGALTPSELMAAQLDGFREVKLFPAEQFGGIDLVKTLGAVFPDLSFVPTGGIDHDSALRYLEHPQVVGVAGSWIAPTDLIAGGDWDEIARRAQAIGRRRRPLADSHG